jgi:hypothetical protein
VLCARSCMPAHHDHDAPVCMRQPHGAASCRHCHVNTTWSCLRRPRRRRAHRTNTANQTSHGLNEVMALCIGVSRAYASVGRSVSPANFGMDDIIAQLGSLTGELADAPAEQLQLIAAIDGCYASGQLQVQCAEHCTSRTPRTGVRVQESRTELHVQAGEEWTPPVGSTYRTRALLCL